VTARPAPTERAPERPAAMIATRISHASAGLLLLGGVARRFAPAVVLAGVYGWLLLRGPLERDLQAYRRGRPAAS
jgi:hypothetical protein